MLRILCLIILAVMLLLHNSNRQPSIDFTNQVLTTYFGIFLLNRVNISLLCLSPSQLVRCVGARLHHTVSFVCSVENVNGLMREL